MLVQENRDVLKEYLRTKVAKLQWVSGSRGVDGKEGVDELVKHGSSILSGLVRT